MLIQSASNFRRLPHVRAGTLFRSDHLGALDADDARQIQSLGIRRVLDFRGIHERTSAACVLPEVSVHSLAIEPTVVQVLKDLLEAGHELSEAEVVAHMQDTYRGFVRQSSHRFREFFDLLLASNEPTVFHCTAGKDRTGFAAALVLFALDVGADEVMRDYLLTNERLKPAFIAGSPMPRQVLRVLTRVQPEFIEAAYQAVQQDFGSIEGYLRDGLGLRQPERDRLRELYLES